MSSTVFTAPPEWHWLVILYFFVGGLAGGCFFLAVLIDLFGGGDDRPLARLGYYVAFPAVVLSGLLLIADLRVPTRFWHMLIASNTLRPMFKTYSPMSLGSRQSRSAQPPARVFGRPCASLHALSAVTTERSSGR